MFEFIAWSLTAWFCLFIVFVVIYGISNIHEIENKIERRFVFIILFPLIINILASAWFIGEEMDDKEILKRMWG